MTGRRSSAVLAGVQMFRYRQSSLVAGGFSPGIETPFCMHAGANEMAWRVPFQGTTGCGSRQRSSPTGGAANGTPIYIVRASFVTPSIAPDSTRAGFAHVLAAIRHSAPATLPLRQQFDIDILR